MFLIEFLKTLPLLWVMIKEIQEEIKKHELDCKVKDKVNELREINKAKNVKALNDNLNGR